ncbi:MAG: hypothetical protein ACOCUR_00745 [Nanoarchaeota archaeon]
MLGKKKLEALRKMPLIETTVRRSKDGSYLINKTTITSIKPVEYYQAVLDSEAPAEEEPEQELIAAQEEKLQA